MEDKLIQRTLLYDKKRTAKITVTFGVDKDGDMRYEVASKDCMVIACSSGLPTSSWQKKVEWIKGFLKNEYGNFEIELIGENKLRYMSEREQVECLKKIYSKWGDR